MKEIQLEQKSIQIEKQTPLCIVSQEDIRKMLHWYKEEYFLVKEAIFRGNELTAHIKFSDYPFIKGKMPFVSSNLINLVIDQVALVHIGLMIKYHNIQVRIIKTDGLETDMDFEEYNRIVGDEFVTAKIEGKYHKPILPWQEIEILSKFLGMKMSFKGRYIFNFRMRGERFFNNEAIFVYPLNLHLVRG